MGAAIIRVQTARSSEPHNEDTVAFTETSGVIEPAAPGNAPSGSLLDLSVVVRILVGALCLVWAQWWHDVSPAPAGAGLLAVLTTALGVGAVIAALSIRSAAGRETLDRYLFLAVLALVACVLLLGGATHGYGTDEAAYDQAAAEGLVHGVNPYGADFSPVLTQYGVAPTNYTYTLSGTLVTSIAYPSLSFLVYVPLVAFTGNHTTAALVVDTTGWLVAICLLWRWLPSSWRPAVPLLLLLPDPLLWVQSGSTDSLFVPLLMVAVWRWERFTDQDAGFVARWSGPVCLGLACCIKQTPWVVAPFLLVGVVQELRSQQRSWLRPAAGYVMAALVPFAFLNLPFIIWNSGAWFDAVALPLRSHLLPLGIGPVNLAESEGVGAGNLSLFGLLADITLLAALLAFLRWYGRLKPMLPLIPVACLLLSNRALGSYILFPLPAFLLAAATTRELRPAPLTARARRSVDAGLAVCAAGLAAVGVLLAINRAPLTLVPITAQGGHHLRVILTVEDSGERDISPAFLLTVNGYTNGQFQIVSGPGELRAGTIATYVLFCPTPAEITPGGNDYRVLAVTTAPDTVSLSPALTAGPP